MITLKNVVLRRGTKVLLDGATITLNPGEKIALVGRNGAGKSTLFALLTGHLHEESGEVHVPRLWRMAQVAQHMPETEESATEFVLGGDSRLMELQQRLQQLEANPDTAHVAGQGTTHEHTHEHTHGLALAQVHSDLSDAGVHDATARAQALILGLGFTPEQLHHSVNSFSGGWRMRLQLARALMCPSDLLLLDEPTNHLDLDALVWLESWLKRYAGTLLVISHDREFLDAVTQVTVHIEKGRLTRYGGNYSTFEVLRAQQLDLQQAAYSKQQEKIAHLQKFIDRFKAKASKAKQAQSRVKALERMEKVAPLLTEAEFTFEFKEPGNLPNPMLSIQEASFGYRLADTEAQEPEAVAILSHVQRSVQAGQRIGILGANGQGKSTLVKTIARALPLLAGRVVEGKGLHIGYFAQQELDVLRSDETPLQHMIRLSREPALQHLSALSKEQDLRNFLGSFNFTGDMVQQAVGSMSGGEKARLVLAMIVWQRPNLLLLDEPTNHLDLNTREALSVALNEFEGTVMLVSHDRALLRSVCDEFWLVGRGGVQPFEGDLDDYQSYLLEESRRLRELARSASSTILASAAVQSQHTSSSVSEAVSASLVSPAALGQREQRRLEAQQRQQLAEKMRPLKKELEQINLQLEKLTAEKITLEERLCTPLSPQDIAQCGRELKQVVDRIDSLEERWLEVSDALENITPSA